MIHSGVQYYIELLSLSQESYRIHYGFESGVGLTLENLASGFANLSGQLSSIGSFYNQNGSGFFTGQTITVSNSTGMISDEWTHIFVLNKTGSGRAVLFDSYITGSPNSGYQLGISDSNKLFFESYDQLGPFIKIDSTILGRKNISAITKSSNALSFYNYDFNNDEVLANSFPINSNFIPSSSKGKLGRNTSTNPNYLTTGGYNGYIDNYLYFTESLTPFTFKYIVSGLFSDINKTNIISGYVVNEITGFNYQITGVTGITGYQNVITGSGLSPFGTGEYDIYYTTSGVTGFLTTGLALVPLSGNITYNVTGDVTTTIIFNTGLIKQFGLNEISYLRKIDYKDLNHANLIDAVGAPINKIAQYNNVDRVFTTDNIYNNSNISVFANTQLMTYQGSIVTGNFYSSGNFISGDYNINNFNLDFAGYFSGADSINYDNITGVYQYIRCTGNTSGSNLPITATGELIFPEWTTIRKWIRI
jgi:hypothetical protein